MALEILTSNELEETGIYIENFDERVHEKILLLDCQMKEIQENGQVDF